MPSGHQEETIAPSYFDFLSIDRKFDQHLIEYALSITGAHYDGVTEI